MIFVFPALATPWHDALERLEPREPSPWAEIVQTPGLTGTSWISADRLWSCGLDRCRSWDLRGSQAQEHPLQCSTQEMIPSPDGRWVAYRCDDAWVRWDTKTHETDRQQRVGDAAIDHQGLISQVVHMQGIWGLKRGRVIRMLDLDLSGEISRDLWPRPANGDAQIYTSHLTGKGRAIWFQDGPKIPIDGGVLVIGERTIVSHMAGGYSEVTAGGMRKLKGAPKAGWPGRGGLSGHGPWGENGVLWWFEKGVVMLDEELRPVTAHTLPEHADLWSSPDGTTLFAHQRAEGRWYRLELGAAAKQ